MERLNNCLKMLECGSDHGEESSRMPEVPKHDTGPSVGGASQHAWRVGDSYGHLAHVGVNCSHGVHLDQGLGHGEDVHELGSGNGYIRDVVAGGTKTAAQDTGQVRVTCAIVDVKAVSSTSLGELVENTEDAFGVRGIRGKDKILLPAMLGTRGMFIGVGK